MLDNLSALVSVTLGGSVCILLFLAAGPLLSKRFTPRWRYCAWGVLAAVLILFQPLHTMLPKPEDWSGLIQLSIPQAVEAGAIPDTVEIIEVEDVPLAYYAGNTNRVKIKAAGDLAN